ncbi:beta-ketoacyl-[acyl-carrier-protein] synthase family protein [Actinomadura barringtoniae]|uniref:Beta-ketoacyl-[acyl-carrier-protein] synthase family protein n=1 Tax=Actinomadura barringtoniae TaxID=1427535 RepID=A0A939P5W4_9ACTN|nr:beta-ketoacyl-[acyl-carrier-protein] synthase family protein [Actinomadura barringtoniae]MBO2445916.1 beta-ketoacyl-[acyl-carrier-protein] synthase family protein [Actinomadura barringtoniae]
MPLAITGADVLSSVGAGSAEHFEALCAGTSGLGPLLEIDPSSVGVRFGYQITDGRPVMHRTTQWLVRCMTGAIADSGLDLARSRVGVVVATGLRELRSVELWSVGQGTATLADLHVAQAVREALGPGTPTLELTNACAAGGYALAVAADLVDLDRFDAVVVAAADTLTESMLAMIGRVTPVPAEALRPFEAARRGVLLGDGAAAVVLERLDHARHRDARPLARLRSVGLSCDAHHETAPDRDGLIRAMRDAFRRAAVAPAEIDLIMAHGTGTALNDPAEALAIKEVFGSATATTAISALKSMIGHTSGASGLIAVVTAIEAIRQGRVPPTVMLETVIKEAEGLDLVRGSERPAEVDTVQVNAFGFGGVNSVAILEGAAS